jgi:hypothetical protein
MVSSLIAGTGTDSSTRCGVGAGDADDGDGVGVETAGGGAGCVTGAFFLAHAPAKTNSTITTIVARLIDFMSLSFGIAGPT